MNYFFLTGLTALSLLLAGCTHRSQPPLPERPVEVTAVMLNGTRWQVQGNGEYNAIRFANDGTMTVFDEATELGKGTWAVTSSTLVLDYAQSVTDRKHMNFRLVGEDTLVSETDDNEERWHSIEE